MTKLEEAVNEAKKNRKWRHEYMTLLMRDQENRELGKEEGLQEGRQEGIIAMITTLKELKIADSVILSKVCEKFDLAEDTAKTYL